MADLQEEEYHTLNPLFPCSDPIPVVQSVKKNVLVPVGVLAGLLFLSTILFAVLFSLEKTKSSGQTTGKPVLISTDQDVSLRDYSREKIMFNAILYQSR